MGQEQDARAKRLQSIGYHIVRIVLFATAVTCAIVGMLMLTFSSNTQSRVQQATTTLVGTKPQVDVLLVLSYDDSDVITAKERTGVVDIMRMSSVHVDVEYLDVHHYATSPVIKSQQESLLASKVDAHGPYSAVICADDEALSFVEKNHDTMFEQTPVIFFGVNDERHAKAAAQNGYATGYYENAGLENTMHEARAIFPNAKRFVAIVDSTEAGIGSKKQFEDAMGGFPGMDVEYIDVSTLTREGLRQRLEALTNDSILFYLDASLDSEGNIYTIDENSYFMSEAAKVPVFRATSGGVGEGVLGAGFTDPELAGQNAASTTIQVLNGKKPADIALVTDPPIAMVFDSAKMGEFGIPEDKLSADTVLINQPAISWATIRPMVLPVVLMVIALVCILGFALMGYRRSVNDTREIIKSRNDLQHRLYFDRLTDLPNLQWLNEMFLQESKSDKVKSVVKFDIDEFSDINDSYGHSVGDQVIKKFAERLKQFDSVVIVHPGADEFFVGFDHPIKSDGAEIDALREEVDRPVIIDDYEIALSSSVGVANKADGMKTDALFSGADLAIRNAKEESGKHAIAFFAASMREEVEERVKITDKLKEAIDNESLVVLYQPQIDAKTLDVCGYEALMRLEDNVYFPDKFIPVAEMSGLVIDLDRIMTKKVIQQLATWKRRHKRLRPVSINYSATQFKDVGYIDFLEGLLKENDVEPNYIKIEITESLLIDREDQAEILFSRLKKAGIPIALDDFGTGYTSLSRVSTLPADIVKIDKSLVDTYLKPGKEGFLDDLVRLIHGIDKNIIVEGVETEEQFKMCQQLGCDVVQGYFFSRPILPERAVQYEVEKK